MNKSFRVKSYFGNTVFITHCTERWVIYNLCHCMLLLLREKMLVFLFQSHAISFHITWIVLKLRALKAGNAKLHAHHSRFQQRHSSFIILQTLGYDMPHCNTQLICLPTVMPAAQPTSSVKHYCFHIRTDVKPWTFVLCFLFHLNYCSEGKKVKTKFVSCGNFQELHMILLNYKAINMLCKHIASSYMRLSLYTKPVFEVLCSSRNCKKNTEKPNLSLNFEERSVILKLFLTPEVCKFAFCVCNQNLQKFMQQYTNCVGGFYILSVLIILHRSLCSFLHFVFLFCLVSVSLDFPLYIFFLKFHKLLKHQFIFFCFKKIIQLKKLEGSSS